MQEENANRTTDGTWVKNTNKKYQVQKSIKLKNKKRRLLIVIVILVYLRAVSLCSWVGYFIFEKILF